MVQMSARTARIIRSVNESDPSLTPAQIIADIKHDNPGTGVPSSELTIENVQAALQAKG
jgi:hypothetical protein